MRVPYPRRSKRRCSATISRSWQEAQATFGEQAGDPQEKGQESRCRPDSKELKERHFSVPASELLMVLRKIVSKMVCVPIESSEFIHNPSSIRRPLPTP